MADTILKEHHGVENNGEKALPKGFYPNYFHRLRYIRDNLDFSIPLENMKNFRTSPWYSKNMESVITRYHSIRETNGNLKNIIYRNPVVTQTASGVGGGDVEEFAGNSKIAAARRNAPTYKTRRPDNLKTWTDYGNFDRDPEKQVIRPKARENGIVSPESTATTPISKTNEIDWNFGLDIKTAVCEQETDQLKQQPMTKHTIEQYDRLGRRCSYDTRADAGAGADVQTSSSTDGQLVHEAAEKLRDAGKKEMKTDKERPNLLIKLWRRITRKPNKKTSSKKRK